MNQIVFVGYRDLDDRPVVRCLDGGKCRPINWRPKWGMRTSARYEWSSAREGAAELAYAMLTISCGHASFGPELCTLFTTEVIAKLPISGWAITETDVWTWWADRTCYRVKPAAPPSRPEDN